MHFIQNSWFAVYSIWIILLTLGVVGIISYVHNRQKYLNKIAVYFSITLLTALAFSFNSERSLFISAKQIDLSAINNSDNQVESPSLVNTAFRYIGFILRDKISD